MLDRYTAHSYHLSSDLKRTSKLTHTSITASLCINEMVVVFTCLCYKVWVVFLFHHLLLLL